MTSINGFPVTQNRASIDVRSLTVPGTQVVLPVRRDIAPLLIGLAQEFHERVEPLKKGECWGYAFRNVRGGQTPSFHSAGIAIDLNAPKHPLGARGTFTPAQALLCRVLAKKYGCRWGGDYKKRADEMHFEVIVPHAQALGLVKTLQQPPGPKPSSAPPYPGFPLKNPPVTRHEQVRSWQQRMRANGFQITVDGIYGNASASACRSLQKQRGLHEDGVVGPKTWAATWSS